MTKVRMTYITGMILTLLSSCGGKTAVRPSEKEKLLSSFSGYEEYESNYRAVVSQNAPRFHFQIRAMTCANFDSLRYLPSTIYILKHESGDSIVIKTSDNPLLSHEQFQDFYYLNKNKLRADTLVDSGFLDQFYIDPTEGPGQIEIGEIAEFPFVFLDVNFNGYPSLLIRRNLGDGLYKFDVYGITEKGYNKVDFPPFNLLKNHRNNWFHGGATEIDYDSNTITVYLLEPGSCSDYGTTIKQIYTLNRQTDRFDLTQIKGKYDFTY